MGPIKDLLKGGWAKKASERPAQAESERRRGELGQQSPEGWRESGCHRKRGAWGLEQSGSDGRGDSGGFRGGVASSLNHSTTQKAFQEVPGEQFTPAHEGQRGHRGRSRAQSPAGGSSRSLRRRALNMAPTH